MSTYEEQSNTSIEARNGNMTGHVSTAATDTGSQASPTSMGSSSARTSFQSHGRAYSMATEGPSGSRPNRFSVQFPIQSGSYSPIRTSISPVREQVATSTDSLDAPRDPSDGNYLHLIAAQERRVLELKEELHRAEADLNRLKRDWARHEANKKRDDAKRVTRLQPLQTSLLDADIQDDVDGSSAWMQQEMERRKALMSATKASSRTVFPGQRHTRALSLLSKDNVSASLVTPRPPPPRKDSLKNVARQSMDIDVLQDRPILKTRASTKSDVAQNGPAADDDPLETGLDHELIFRAGKKVATEFKDGLWTFWEDIRQATVGEDSTPIPLPQRKASTQTLRTAKKQSSRNSLAESSKSSSTIGKGLPNKKKSSTALPDLANPSFWTDHGALPSAQASAKKGGASKLQESTGTADKRSSGASMEAWDNWDDSPVQSRSSSSVTSENTTLPSTVSGSPRPSISANRESRDMSRKDSIPWPAIKKSGLGSLRRTASHLLSEWERSLTPSPGQEYTGDDDLMSSSTIGASAEAAAYGTSSKSAKHD